LEIGLSFEALRKPQFTREERHRYGHRLLALPLLLFGGLVLAWLGVLTLLLAVPTPFAVLLAVPCGMLIGMLFIVGHDAAHNSFTSSRLLNQVIGRLAFLPALHAFSLWDLSHNRTHHPHNNVRSIDYAWEPMTPGDYRSLSAGRQAFYRFCRAPLGVPFYYPIVMWPRYMFVPLPSVIGRVGAIFWLDSAAVIGFLMLQILGVTLIGDAFGTPRLTSIVTGVVLPFLVWNGLMSVVVFLHHTHPDIWWYRDDAERAAHMGGLRGTAHVVFPGLARLLLLNIMDHNAHHFASGVPLYRLPRMQASLELQDKLVTWRLSGARFARVCRECKLYDYDAKRWLTFDDPMA
jgi:omega-6 fatty acid desaturase (delta-12 desaturase)